MYRGWTQTDYQNKHYNILFLNINQLDALNIIISLFRASTRFEHMCSSSGGQKFYYKFSGIITLKQVNGLKLLKQLKLLKFNSIIKIIKIQFYKYEYYIMNQKDEETQDDRARDGGTNFILRIKEQETCLTLQEHHDDDDDEIQSGPKNCIDSLLINIFGINLNEISISG